MKYVALMLLALLQVLISVLLSYKRYSKVSRIFLLFTGALFLWTIANITLDYAYNNTGFSIGESISNLELLNLSNRAGFFMGTVTLVLLYRLVQVFPTEKKPTKLSKAITVFGGLVAMFALTDAVAGRYVLNYGATVPTYLYGDYALIIFGYFLLVAIYSVRLMVNSIHKSRDALVRKQIKTILSALLITAALAILIITIIPVVIEDDSFIFLGYFTPYIFTAALLYSIFRQRFLNFRPIVARSVGYLLSILTLAFAYGLATFLIVGRIFFPNSPLSIEQELVFIVFTVVLAFTFQPLRQFFNKISNKIFYKDAYEPSVVLEELNRLLASTIDLNRMLQGSADIIQSYIKAEFVSFALDETKDKKRRVIGDKKVTSDDFDLFFSKRLQALRQEVIISDTLMSQGGDLGKVLSTKDIAVLARLRGGADSSKPYGYIVLGAKKSGNPYTSQDVKLLDIIVNQLSIAIQNALRFEEIQQFNVTLQRKIDEATRDLRKANEKLKAMDETKDEFISMASHQLRTPLTSVKGYVSMVLEGDAGKLNPMQKKLLEQTFFSAQRMVYLIADLLNVSRLRTGKFLIEPKPTDLAELVSAEVTQLLPTAKARNLELTFKRPKNFPQVMLDETKTRQVIMNFIDNAIYYTHPGGHIAVELKETDEAIEFTVTDDGLGVPKAEQHRLFTKFYRANNAKKARPDGTGLGLFMAKKVVVAQGGAIIFKSQEGKGSTFGFTFAKAKLKVPSKSSAQSPSTVLAVK